MSFAFQNKLKLISTEKIWADATHTAFTDLIFYQKRWWCVFRESDLHVLGANGVIRLIVSEDGKRWSSAQVFQVEGVDLRDPKLSETPDGRLMLLMGGSVYENKNYVTRQPRATFSIDGTQWSSLSPILEPEEWLWRVTWHQGKAYGVSYRHSDPKDLKQEWNVSLFESDDGIHYRLLSAWDIPGYPNEATLRFLDSGQMVALVRRDKKQDRAAWIGTSAPPYKDWHWNSTNCYLGGPNFLVLEDGSMLAAGRMLLLNPYDIQAQTVVAGMQVDKFTPLVVLPSGGDTSYPGMVKKGSELWISYYSSHEGKSAIYLSKLSFV